MTHNRDLFRAIVISGAALVGGAGCNDDVEVADAGHDASVPRDMDTNKDLKEPFNADAFPAIL